MNKKQILTTILVISAILRLFALSNGDTINDEVFYAFRGIGMMDFDEAAAQTTPLEWYDPDIPVWTSFSFHDHPPLVFATQNISMKIFGENNFGFRFPSAILGIASVYLIYLIGTILYSANTGLISAGILGVTLNNIYISRVGMQEAYVIFFILLASYLFLKSLENSKYLIKVGVVIGLALLTKYTSIVLIPIFLTYLALFKPTYLKKKYFWIGTFLAILIFSPVITYNMMLYINEGHFDFQVSHIVGQSIEEWQSTPGKEIGSLSDRIENFVPRLISTNSWLLLSLFIFSVLGFLFSLFKNTKVNISKHKFLIISFIFLLILISLIGPSYRFLTMLTPFFALSIAVFINYIYDKFSSKKILLVLFGLFVLFELSYSTNNQLLDYPVGPSPWLSSEVRFENYNWGYNNLNEYLKNELEDKMPAISFDMRYQFLQDIRDKSIEQDLNRGLTPYPALIIYSRGFDKLAKLWVLDRLHIYHAWPIISMDTYFQYLNENGFDFYEKNGFKDYYFIISSNAVLSQEVNNIFKNISPKIIYNNRGDEAFKIYKF